MTIGRKIVGAILLLMGLNLAVTNVSAQVVYTCDFEDATENAKWTLNKIGNSANLRNWKNIWRIGQPGNCVSEAGLYIRPNGGVGDTLNMAVSISSSLNDYIVAYRDSIQGFTPLTQYRLSFDWRASGKLTDYLYVFWVPVTQNTNSNINTASRPNWNQLVASLRGKELWQTFETTFKPTSNMGKLVFMWYQASGYTMDPPAAIDNIEIVSSSVTCDPPTGLAYDPSGKLTWSGSASSYDVRYLNTNTLEWIGDTTTATTYILKGIDEGTYTFQVRSRCENGIHSSWVSISQFIWVRGKRCVDYFDYGTSSTSVGKCYVGKHLNSDSHTSLHFETTPRVVDDGPGEATSMHTLHTDVGEIDPNTKDKGGLHTVPKGEIASIRLGAYTTSGEDARIEYQFTVQKGQSDLLDLQYACVLNSGGHDDDNPFFQLEILDQSGKQIDGCTQAYFVADMSSSGSGWHCEGTPGTTGAIYWCDWRKVTVSLVNFQTQRLTIRLTSSRCVYDTHFGYAYFTLKCRGAALEGLSCGEFDRDRFVAPSGFHYRWYKQSDENTLLGTDSVFMIPANDSALYKVDLISLLEDSCYYTIPVNPNPRFPETRVTYDSPQTTQRDCQNIVRFHNSSGVVYINRVDYSRTIAEDEVEDVIWDYGDGVIEHKTSAVVEHTFPQKGGTYNVIVSASMSGGVCTDPDTITLVLPELGDKRVETVEQYCYKGNNPYIYKGQPYTDSFADTATVTLPTGCDSTGILTVNFVGVVEAELHDTICGERMNYTYNGTVFPDSGTYKINFEGASALGCDSVVTLHLYKHPIPKIQVDSAFVSCADEMVGLTLPYLLTGDLDATVDSIHVRMGDEAVANGFQPSYDFAVNESLDISWPDTIKPNVYQGVVEFSSPWCTTYTYPFKIELDYPSSVLDQKNGLVAVLNSAANGGYEFLSYQWYRNDERMDGETASYVRVSDEDDMGAEFYVVVLRNGDNVVLRSCPIKYVGGRTALDNISDSSRAVKVMENGIIYIIRDGVRYTVLGTIVSRHEQE